MDPLLARRINLAACWASNRIAVLDRLEKYEDSYAIAEEFREWILSLGQDSAYLSNTILNYPNNISDYIDSKTNDHDQICG